MTKTTKTLRISTALVIIFCMLLGLTVPAFAAYSTGTYKVNTPSGINVRSGAGSSCKLVGASVNGTKFTVSKISGSWGYTKSIKCTNGYKSGWVSLAYCAKQNSSSTQKTSSYSIGSYKVTANSGINVRKGADSSYSKVGAACKGVTFSVSKISGNWGYTKSIKCTNGYKSGWVSLSYCSKQNQSPSSTNSSATVEHKNTYANQTVSENNVVYEYVTVSVDTSSFENWTDSIKTAENYVCNSKKGVIVAAKVKSTKTVFWKVSAAAVYQGPGITGFVTRKYTVPSTIEYKVHKHTRNLGFGKSWYYAGGNIVVLYTCDCGYRKELMEWTIPIPDLTDTTDTQTTQKVIQGLPQIK